MQREDDQEEKTGSDEAQEKGQSDVASASTERDGGGPTQNSNGDDSKDGQQGRYSEGESSSSAEKKDESSIREKDNDKKHDGQESTPAPKSPLASEVNEEDKTADSAANRASTTTNVNPSQSNDKTITAPKQDTKSDSSTDSNTGNGDSGTVSAQVKVAAPNKPQKVKVHFVAVGSAPLMKKAKFLISPKESFSRLQEKLTKMLQLKDSSNTKSTNHLFLYLHQSFVPSPEDLIGDLNDLFSVRGELILHYSLQEAWG